MIDSNSDFLFYYSIVNTLLFIGLLVSHKTQKFKLVLGLLLLTLVSILYSIRTGDVGSDAGAYLQYILDANAIEQEMSPAIGLIGSFVNFVHGGSTTFFLIISLIINITMLYAFYRLDKKYYLIYMAIYSTTFLFINTNINLLRQGMAISVGFLAITFLIEYKIKRYFLIVFITIFIHSSAIILLVPFFLLKLRNTKYVFIFISIITLLYAFHVTGVDLLYYIHNVHWTLDRLYWYLTWERVVEFNIKHVYYLYIGLILMYLYKINHLDLKLKRLFLTFLPILIVMTFFRSDDFVVDRFSFYFIPIAVVLFLNLHNVYNIYNKYYLALFTILPFLWIMKSSYQFNLWWILKVMR